MKETNKKFKVGDIVEIVGNRHSHCFKMGEKVKIIELGNGFSEIDYKAKYLDGHDYWWVFESDIKAIDTTSNKVKEIKRKAKKGEYIKLIYKTYSFDEVGDILKIDGINKNAPYVLGKNHVRDTVFPNNMWLYREYEYVVLEGYKPIEKESIKMKFKVGDKVKLARIDDEYFPENYRGYLNSIYTISKIVKNEYDVPYCFVEENNHIFPYLSSLDLVEPVDNTIEYQGIKYDVISINERYDNGLDYLLFKTKEHKESILDEREKEYLNELIKYVVKPMRKKIVSVYKQNMGCKEFIKFYADDDVMTLFSFKAGTMYKGMKQDENYTLEELGLEKENNE